MEKGQQLPEKMLKGLWLFLKGVHLTFILSLLYQGASVAFQTANFLLIRFFVDRVITEGRWETSLALIGVGFLLLAAMQGLLSFLAGRSSAYASEMAIRKVRDWLYDHMQRLSFAYHDKMKTGELIQRATSDVDTIRRFYSEQVKGFARIAFLVVINFSTILFLNWKLALLTVAAIPLMLAASIFFFKRIHDAYEAYQEQDGKLSAVLQENLSGVRIVRAFARQKFEEEKFEEQNGAKLKLGYRFLMAHATYWPVSEVLGGMQFLIGLIAGGIMVINGSLSVGTFVAYVGIAKGIIWPLQQLGRLIAQISTSTVSYGRVRTILNESQEDVESGFGDHGKGLSGDINFHDVCFEYEKGIPVLHDINFKAAAGQKIALLGEPGSGKTTLVNLLPRFYEHSSGELYIDGKRAKEYSKRYLRSNVGIVEQEPFLFSTDIRSNITYGVHREVGQDEVERVAKAAAIHESITSFPKGYETLVGEKGVTLSGGQKQRIAIARTLLKDPAILILDDSTSSVDAETEDSIRDALDELMEGRTTFIIAHRIQSLMNADQILVFSEGKIIQRGTHEELIHDPGFYAKVFELQTRIEMELEEQLVHG